MNNFLKNILLLVLVLVLSYYTLPYFGLLLDYFIPGTLGDTAWIGTPAAWRSLIGTPFAYIFFLTIIFQSFALGNRNKWTLWLLSPALLFFASGDLKHIYLPIILGLIALGLSILLQKIFKTGKYQSV
mgnify:CR=1 FL=1